MGIAAEGHSNNNDVSGEASTHEHRSKQHSHICRNCGATFTPQKGVPLVRIGAALIIIPIVLEVVCGMDLPNFMVGGPTGVGVILIFLGLDNDSKVSCPHCGNADGNVGLLTPMGQKLYKDLHEKQV